MPFASVVLKSFLVVGRIFCRLVNVYLSSPSLVLLTPFVDSHTLMSFRAGHFICNSIHELVPFLLVPLDFVAYQTFVAPLWYATKDCRLRPRSLLHSGDVVVHYQSAGWRCLLSRIGVAAVPRPTPVGTPNACCLGCPLG
jgi:hypothetical protein